MKNSAFARHFQSSLCTLSAPDVENLVAKTKMAMDMDENLNKLVEQTVNLALAIQTSQN